MKDNPGISVNSKGSSSSTSLSQESLRKEADQASGPVFERNDEQVTRRLDRNP